MYPTSGTQVLIISHVTILFHVQLTTLVVQTVLSTPLPAPPSLKIKMHVNDSVLGSQNEMNVPRSLQNFAQVKNLQQNISMSNYRTK